MSLTLSERIGGWVAHPARVAVTILLLLAMTVVLQLVKDRRDEIFRPQSQSLYLPSAAVLSRMALSFDAVLADVYWMRALQHYGGTRRSEGPEKNYELLYPLLDITTALDPRFNVAYRFGAIFLAEAYPDGPGRPDQAIALLRKGAEQMPERWEYLMDIGFVYYWSLHDYEEAARWFQRASEIPGSAWWLSSLAANTLAQGGNRDDSRTLWQQIHDTADDEWLRTETQRRLFQLDALDEIDRLRAQAQRFEQRTGRWPATWRDLVGGQLPRAPVDPLGYSYGLDPASRTVDLSPQSPLWPLPAEPPGTAGP